MKMGEIRHYSIQKTLKNVGRLSQISHFWEILKVLMMLHNVSPIWMPKSLEMTDLYATEKSQQYVEPEYISRAHPLSFYHYYFWSKYPLQKESKLNFSAFGFDIPSTVLFFLNPIAAVVLLKLYTYLGKKLGLDTESEEPVLIPTR